MAGGKETPRQKMIGMMYLVLTALLALNVSKEVIAAFVTINDKLDRSAQIINNNNQSNYSSFDKKITTVKAQGGDVKTVQVWQERAYEVQKLTTEVVSYLLGEANEMIKISEGADWVEEKDEEGNITKLKPLSDITGMDNYDIPTNLFIGGNPDKPAQRGLDIRLKVIEYRNAVAKIMATYKTPKGDYTFDAPEDLANLDEALLTANPQDTAQIKAFMRSLDLPEEITQKIHGEEETHKWPAVMFDHAPIVAAAAMLTALKLDVKNSESMATEFLLSKVDVQEFDFNKIEPLAFASTGYINQGDSLNLRVMIAAYDSTETPDVKWGQDADTSNQDGWKPATNADGSISLIGEKPGLHKVKGVIYVKQRGVKVPKPWEFDYTVGQPMGVVALPEMRVLYRGYNNIVEGTASGFPADRVTLSGSGCSISKSGNQYIAKVGAGVREATISVNGKKDDGGSVNLGSFKFKVKALPTPALYLGGISNGANPGLSSVRAQGRLSCRYDESVPLTGVTFTIVSGTVSVDGIMRKGKITRGGNLDANAKQILAQSSGKQVTIMVNYKGPDNVTKRTSLVFTTR
ncbi:type IX secretion system motor protein PorM/GldM [Crocinitomix algicola]|uniref:type IX secretion system motor protein PorM/GldM n=1 Tax=Crocinitomix algicola TaxID=1740263 RepID=UPI000872380C|nr:GldM family protein [Crocinitomix algicola]